MDKKNAGLSLSDGPVFGKAVPKERRLAIVRQVCFLSPAAKAAKTRTGYMVR
jgi:hypothetical protein